MERQPRPGAGFDEASQRAAEQVARDEQVFGRVVVVVPHRQRHRALERARHALGERGHDLEPAPRRHIGEADRRSHRARVVGGDGHVGVEREDRIARECAGRTPQAFERHLIGRGELHGAVEPCRVKRSLRGATRAGQHQGPLEEARGLRGQLWQLALQRLELTGRRPRRSAR